MPDDELEQLAEDIFSRHGLLHPIK